MSSETNETQVGGTHYKKSPLQHWDVVALYRVDYFRACATKYLLRWPEKNGPEDIEKGIHYLQKRSELGEYTPELTKVPDQVIDHLLTVHGITAEITREAVQLAFNNPYDMTVVQDLLEWAKKYPESYAKSIQIRADRDYTKLQGIIDSNLYTSPGADHLLVPGTPEDGGHHARQPVSIQTLDDIVPEAETRERHPLNCTWAEYVAIQSRVIDHGTYAGHSWGQLYIKDDEGRYAMMKLYHQEYGKL